MPIIFVNPAGHKRARPKKKGSAKMARGRKKKKSVRGRGGRFVSKRKARKSKSRTPKKLARGLYRVNPAAKRRKKRKAVRHSRRRARRSPARRRKSSRRRHAPTTKILRKYAAKKGYKLSRRVKRKGGARKRKTSTRTRVARAMAAHHAHKSYPLANPGRRRKRRKARRSPARRAHRRYRRNPGIGGIMQLAKRALPVLGGMIVGRMITKQIAARVPGVSKLGQLQGPALSIGMLFLGNVATNKVKALGKWKDPIMLGLGINVVTELLSMIPQVKGFLGLGEGIYDRALSDYVTTSDYLTTGAAPPIDDDIALSDYITTGGLEEELGLSEELGMGLSEELGVSEMLGMDAGTVPGGLSQTAMIKTIPHQSFMAEVPARSFSKEISHAGPGFDNPGALYAGIFRGGF